MASDDASKHVFISYVHEDSDAVDKLCSILEVSQIPYWRDRTSLAPGDAWKSEIRKAIRDGSLVFLACFSDSSRARTKSHMNEELTLAVEEFRKMPPGRTWLIPVRLDAGGLPDWDLGAGRSLGDLNYVDLFGDGYAAQAASLATTIQRLMGESRLSPATALASVEQVVDADRAALLKRLTKDMLPDPSRRIELDDLVSQEVQRVLTAMKDPAVFPINGLAGTGDEQVISLVGVAQRYWTLVEAFCHSLQVASRWASPDLLAPWASGLRAFVNAATKVEGGNTALLDLRHIPAVASIATAGLACSAANTWANLKALIIDPSIRERHSEQQVPLIEATDPYSPFSNAEWVPQVLARAARADEDAPTALAHFRERRGGKYYTPVADWLHILLRPVFADQLPDQDTYDSEFDRAEVMLGLISQDCATQRYVANANSAWRARSRWYGRSTWRAANSHGNPITQFEQELQSQGARWRPLQGELFGADPVRAREALDAYSTTFNELARNRF
ncbi:toll/interleukin-1 receptor domain-containing protein [Kribbella sp. NPDC000426]|uniref:toll/interleukin-1 receptor domain-containing protein n=1 Tax=Kribbella sp. NPDC000426 TaxID=3154255 RepID=UPI003323C0FD